MEQSSNRKKIIVIALLLLTILLGATAVAMAYYIQQNQSPDDSSADAVGCDTASFCQSFEISGSIQCTRSGVTVNCCPVNTELDNSTRSCLSKCTVKTNNCVSFGTTINGASKCIFGSVYYNCCPGDQIINGGKCEDPKSTENTCPAGTTINAGKTACVCDNNSSLTFPVGTINAVCTTTCSQVGGTCQSTACTTGQSVAYGACAGGGYCCTGTANNGNGNVDNGNETPSGQTGGSCGSGGTCFQQGGTFNGVTINNCGSVGRVDSSPNSCGAGYLCCASSGGGGTSTPSTSTTSKSQCGGTCNTVADCATSPSGATVTCRNGVCENASCAVGKTVPGANCECSNLNACGQACSASLGLCQAGSECGFIGSPNSCVQNEGKNNGTQFCLPTSPAKGYTLANCSGIAALNLRSPLGTDLTSQAQVLEACNLVTQTSGIGNSGNTSGSTSQVCGDAICSANENSFSCPGDCKLPDTAIVSERTDKVILGILVILLGISLAGGFDKLKRARS